MAGDACPARARDVLRCAEAIAWPREVLALVMVTHGPYGLHSQVSGDVILVPGHGPPYQVEEGGVAEADRIRVFVFALGPEPEPEDRDIKPANVSPG